MATLAVVIPSTIDVLIRGAGRLIVADELLLGRTGQQEKERLEGRRRGDMVDC